METEIANRKQRTPGTQPNGMSLTTLLRLQTYLFLVQKTCRNSKEYLKKVKVQRIEWKYALKLNQTRDIESTEILERFVVLQQN